MQITIFIYCGKLLETKVGVALSSSVLCDMYKVLYSTDDEFLIVYHI